MANATCFACVNLVITPNKSSNSTYVLIPKSNVSPARSPNLNFSLIPNSRRMQPLKAQESESTKTTKINSIVCAECDGNGAILCTQCEGTGVNSKDHFNGRFKAGGLCWLCRGNREILCGNCNGAGFLGGFMSTLED